MNSKIENTINELLAKMTLKEKIGQLNQVSIRDSDGEELKDKIRNGEVGSIILACSPLAGNDEHYMADVKVLNDLQKLAVEESRMKIPVIYGRDVIHGHHTVFPIPLALAASFNMDLIKESYSYISKEAANDGIQWTFAPMLDISRDPRWGRVIESAGEDPYLGMEVARAVVDGFQGEDYTKKESLAACAKHYIGYGASEGGRDYHKTEISDYTLRNYYLKAFKAAVDSGVATVMNSFNEIAGQPTTSSKYLLTEVLRGELGFDGFVVSDWGAVQQLEKQGVAENRKDCTKLAINAGIDMDMFDECYSENLEELIKEGLVTQETLDEAVARVLRIKLRFGLFDSPYTTQQNIDRQKHGLKAKEMAEESMVLLKNRGNILPLAENIKLALIGPMVNQKKALFGSWTLDGYEEEVVTIKEGIQNTAPGARIITAQHELIDEMLMVARRADVIVLALGESHLVTGEARSLTNIELPNEQKELLRRVKVLGKPIVGVMCFGRPIALGDTEGYFDAILYAWHSGTQTGNAVGDILFGKVNPSGKTPITFPRTTGQVPIYYNVPGSGRPVNGYYDDCMNYVDCQSSPLYPFGYGLSYTEFVYSDLKTDIKFVKSEDIEMGKGFSISVTVKNVGSHAGKEIVECYIRDICASMTRPLRELKGFKKVLIQKGESKEILFTLGKEELGFYNADGKFVLEKGKFEIFVGKDCLTENKLCIEVV